LIRVGRLGDLGDLSRSPLLCRTWLESGGGFGLPVDLNETFQRLLSIFLRGLAAERKKNDEALVMKNNPVPTNYPKTRFFTARSNVAFLCDGIVM
jgi:hypothetical protein